MALSLVQHKSGTSTTSNVCNVTLAATGAGNALIVVVSKNSTGDLNLSGITLGGSGTGWASQAYQVGTDAYDLGFWANYAIAGGQTALVVTAASGDTDLIVDVYEVSGGLTGLDQVVFHEVDLTAATWTSTATLTTAQASEFIVGAVNGYNNTGGAFTFTGPASPWANETQLTPAGNSSQLSGYQISSATGTFTYSGTASTTGTNLVYLAAVATFKAAIVVPGTAALSGSGTLTGAGVFAGAAPLSGSGTLTGTGRSTGFGGGGVLTGSGSLSGTVTGTFEYAAVMSGSGALGTAPSVTVLFTGGISTYAATYAATYPGAAPVFSGTGTLSLSGVVLKFPAALSGSGTLSVLQVTGGLVFASPGAATPQAYPLSSQVAVAAPGSSNWQYLGTVGVVTALTYSFTCPGGADQMTATVMVPATYRTQLFNPGWQVRVTRGGHVVWTGKMDEPVPTSSGWNLTASGDGNRGTDYLAIYTSTWPAGQPDQSVNDAIARGLPWVNPGIGTPAGAWFGQAVDTGAQTITALLTLVCSQRRTHLVRQQPARRVHRQRPVRIPAAHRAQPAAHLQHPRSPDTRRGHQHHLDPVRSIRRHHSHQQRRHHQLSARRVRAHRSAERPVSSSTRGTGNLHRPVRRRSDDRSSGRRDRRLRPPDIPAGHRSQVRSPSPTGSSPTPAGHPSTPAATRRAPCAASFSATSEWAVK